MAPIPFSHPGRNTVEIVVTADTAVRYGDDIPYGLKGSNPVTAMTAWRGRVGKTKFFRPAFTCRLKSLTDGGDAWYSVYTDDGGADMYGYIGK